jgi:tRNA pseudouridine38-40 synthase
MLTLFWYCIFPVFFFFNAKEKSINIMSEGDSSSTRKRDRDEEEEKQVETPTPRPVVDSESAPATTTTKEKEKEADAEADGADGGARAKKRKYAILFGYVGENYHGLQLNLGTDVPTIEAAMLKACHEAGLISDDNMDAKVSHKIQWQRASRTDKGVHALRNIISCKFLNPPDGEEKCVERLNALLPKDIRIYELRPVTASFNSYLFCTGRKYDYYLPTYGLLGQEDFKRIFPPSVAPEWPVSDEVVTIKNDERDGPEAVTSAPVGWNDRMYLFKTVPEDVMSQLIDYRITPALIEKIRDLFQVYCGTNRFHNFTPGGSSTQGSMDRYLRSIKVSDPFMREGVEWVKISLDGQSFMLNQIRKMIGCVAVVLATGKDRTFIQECLSRDVRRGIPMSPANGLLLLALDFSRYNDGLGHVQTRSGGGCAAGKQMILLDDEHHQSDLIEEVRANIHSVIARKERDDRIVSRWMRSIRHVVRIAWEESVPE